MSRVSEIERRYIAGAECRASEDSRLIKGTAIVFNSMSVDLGGFREIMKPASVDRAIREGADVRALVDHNSGKVIGRTKSGTLLLRKTPKGLGIEVDPPNTSYANDTLEVVRRGDVSGMSFGFRVMPDGDKWYVDEDGMLIREVHDIELSEVSIVAFPAYPASDVLVSKRSLDMVQQLRGSKLDFLAKQLKVARAR